MRSERGTFFLALALAARVGAAAPLHVGRLPSSLDTGWEAAAQPAAAGAGLASVPAAERFRPAHVEAGVARPATGHLWLRLALDLGPEATAHAVAIELPGLAERDAAFLDGVPLEPTAPSWELGFPAGRGGGIFEVPPALCRPGYHLLLVALAPGSGGDAVLVLPPRLASLRSVLARELNRQLPSAVAALVVLSFGIVALLFWIRDRSRLDLGLYALLAFGTALYVSSPLAFWSGLPGGGRLAGRLLAGLAFLLSATGYLFLFRFLALPFPPARRALLALPAAGVLAAVAVPAGLEGRLSIAAGLVLVVLAADLLLVLARTARGGRPDVTLLFAATAVLLLAVLADAATSQAILPAPLPGLPLLGPAFLFLTGVVLVVVADEGRRLATRATTDSLTRLANKPAFLARAEQELERAARTGESLALVMLDIDHFKSFNDRYGHPVGDRVLNAAGGAITKTVRSIDFAGRYGGEEFVVLLVDADEPAAMAAVERIRTAIAEVGPPRVPEPVHASAGVALHSGRFDRATVAQLIHRADAALYESKRAGRDRATLESRGGPPSSAAEVRYR